RPVGFLEQDWIDVENPGDLVDLHRPGLEELGVLGRHGNGLEPHTAPKHGGPLRFGQPAMQLVPFLADTGALRVVQLARVDQDARRAAAVAEELGPVLVGGDGQSKAVPEQLQDTVAPKPVESKSRYMENSVGRQVHLDTVDNGPIDLLAVSDLNPG